MPLVYMQDMLRHAYRNGYAVGAFALVSLDFLEAIIAGAEACQAPVILSLAESHFAYFDFELTMPAVEAAARRSTVPVAIHLDHGASLESAQRGIRLGCNGIMVDNSLAPLAQNMERTREVAAMAHACDIPVEGELGYVAGVEGEDAERHPGHVIYTSVEEASQYVESTGVDFLAVSIGTVHGRIKGEPKLDFERLTQINGALHLPLVIHGGTGLSPDQSQRLIAGGVAKINYYTALADTAGEQLANNLQRGARGYTQSVNGIQAAIRGEVERCIKLWGGAGRAAELLEQCRPWQNVEHLIFFNLTCTEPQAAEIIAEGKRVLGNIPGVRQVFAGKALNDSDRYRFCWRVQFASAAVVDSYGEHPVHVSYANTHFRPNAGDRVTEDFAPAVTALIEARGREIAGGSERSSA
ncbi:MAG: class II fructose-bisphosphate aldolase [Gammaproteobacteria bacterium]|nr:class II fructose-bisphosphate aldolase [Gammaproteobacteria bacterium]